MTKKDPRVLHLSCGESTAENHVVSLAQDLQRRGIVSFIGCPDGSRLWRTARKHNLALRVLNVKNMFDIVEWCAFWDVVKHERITLIHVHDDKLLGPAIVLKSLCAQNIRIVAHRRKEEKERWYTRFLYSRADRIISVSRAVADRLHWKSLVPREKIKVIYNGCDFRRFSPLVPGRFIRDHYGLGDAPVVGTVTTMNEARCKGVKYLIRAAALLKGIHPELRYLFVGSGVYFGALRAMARMMKVDDRIIFTGYRENAEECMAAMDIFCLLSGEQEPFGQPMVEAQSMHKPVISTCGGGLPEAFLNGVTGLLVPPANAVALAQAISLLAGDRAKREAMGRAAGRFAHANFSIEKMGERTLSLYRSLYPHREENLNILPKIKELPMERERQSVMY